MKYSRDYPNSSGPRRHILLLAGLLFLLHTSLLHAQGLRESTVSVLADWA